MLGLNAFILQVRRFEMALSEIASERESRWREIGDSQSRELVLWPKACHRKAPKVRNVIADGLCGGTPGAPVLLLATKDSCLLSTFVRFPSLAHSICREPRVKLIRLILASTT